MANRPVVGGWMVPLLLAGITVLLLVFPTWRGVWYAYMVLLASCVYFMQIWLLSVVVPQGWALVGLSLVGLALLGWGARELLAYGDRAVGSTPEKFAWITLVFLGGGLISLGLQRLIGWWRGVQ